MNVIWDVEVEWGYLHENVIYVKSDGWLCIIIFFLLYGRRWKLFAIISINEHTFFLKRFQNVYHDKQISRENAEFRKISLNGSSLILECIYPLAKKYRRKEN